MWDTVADIQELQDILAPLQEAAIDRWCETKNDDDFTEGWRLEKAINSLQRTEEKLDDKFWELREIFEDRISRKREEKILKGWLTA